jgi:hypothetical protein
VRESDLHQFFGAEAPAFSHGEEAPSLYVYPSFRCRTPQDMDRAAGGPCRAHRHDCPPSGGFSPWLVPRRSWLPRPCPKGLSWPGPSPPPQRRQHDPDRQGHGLARIRGCLDPWNVE